jgi:hypothetical protein
MANYYVRSGAAGSNNGSDWTNAWHDFDHISWAGIVGDDIIYIAGGTYTKNLSPGASGTVGHPILLHRATVSAHGTETGWNAAYDATIEHDGIGIEVNNRDYITFDGKTAGGWHIDFSSGETGYGVNLSYNNANVCDGITLRYMKIEGPGTNLGAGYANTQGVHAYYVSTPGDSFTMQYVEVCNYSGALCRMDLTNVLVEYCTLHDCLDTVNHEDFIIGYYGSGTYRYNICYNTDAAGFAFADNSGPYYVYGNVLYQTGAYVGNGNAIECQRNTVLYCYNNTVVGFSHGLDTATRTTDSTGDAYNNLFYNCTTAYVDGPVYVHDYNWYYPAGGAGGDFGEANGQTGVGDPFVSSATYDFELQAATLAGKTLSSPYNGDLNGTTRGGDGTWDRGAYEYGPAISPDIRIY